MKTITPRAKDDSVCGIILTVTVFVVMLFLGPSFYSMYDEMGVVLPCVISWVMQVWFQLLVCMGTMVWFVAAFAVKNRRLAFVLVGAGYVFLFGSALVYFKSLFLFMPGGLS